MGTRRRLALLSLAVAIAVLVIAVPAQAGKVAKGSSNITVGPALTHALNMSHVALSPVAPVTMVTKWQKTTGKMYLWFRAPMKAGGTWDPRTGVGTFYHNGSIRIAETSESPQKVFRAEGIRIIALNKSSYEMSVSYPEGAYMNMLATNYTRVTLATSTHTPKITHKGKAYKIDGVQFKLTPEGIAAIENTIGVKVSPDVVFFDTNIMPVLK